MATLVELIAQRDALNLQIEALRKQEKGDATAKARELVKTFGLTSQDLFPPLSVPRTKVRVAPKYRDPATGSTWTGRGKAPTWIADKDRAQFLIA